MMQEMWNGPPGLRPIKSAPCSPAKPLGISRTRSESFHITHKVPLGDSPYVRAKNVQLVEKDPEKAIPLFWAAINAGDRVDSALKDMAIVMKQQNRTEEAIEAIKSLRVRCSDQAQESLDNILLDLYKKYGRLDDQIALLRQKLFLIHQGMAFNGKRTKTARSQGKKFQVSVEQEATRLLGNLGWALMQQNNYIEAEEAYRRALMISSDNNKMCNLGICLMKQGRINEAKDTLRRVKPAVIDGPRGIDSHLKAYERAQQMLNDLESEMMSRLVDRVEQRKLFDSIFSSSSIWQPQPCKEQSTMNLPKFKMENDFPDENISSNINFQGQKSLKPNTLLLSSSQPCKEQLTKNFPKLKAENDFPDENINSNIIVQGQKGLKPNVLNVAAPPFYASNLNNETLKRTRSGSAANPTRVSQTRDFSKTIIEDPENNKTRRKSNSPEKRNELWDRVLPDSKDFEEAIIAAALGPNTDVIKSSGAVLKKIDKRLKVFRDITLSLSPSPSPRA